MKTKTNKTNQTFDPSEISLCPNCNCMTHTLFKGNLCGKCMMPKSKTREDELKWKHNETKESKQLAGTLARYNYESLVDEHNKAIDKAEERGRRLQKIDEHKVVFNEKESMELLDRTFAEGIKQGYAKALADVERAVKKTFKAGSIYTGRIILYELKQSLNGRA